MMSYLILSKALVSSVFLSFVLKDYSVTRDLVNASKFINVYKDNCNDFEL